MGMINSLYMMNFYKQIKDYFASDAAKVLEQSSGSGVSGAADSTQTDFEKAFLTALKASAAKAAGTSAGTENTQTRTASKSAASTAQTAYGRMTSYGCHPSHVWTSRFV